MRFFSVLLLMREERGASPIILGELGIQGIDQALAAPFNELGGMAQAPALSSTPHPNPSSITRDLKRGYVGGAVMWHASTCLGKCDGQHNEERSHAF